MKDSGSESEDDFKRAKYRSKYKTCQVFFVEEKELSSYLKHCSNLQKLANEYAKNLPGHRIPKTLIERQIPGELLQPNISSL